MDSIKKYCWLNHLIGYENENLFTLFLLIALWACKSESKQTNGTASIDLSELSTPSFYDYFSRMDVIPLETSDSSLVNNVDKIVHRNNKFYIMDVKARRIAVFDDNGKYLREINRCGPVPENIRT